VDKKNSAGREKGQSSRVPCCQAALISLLFL
jgi:hypothetical protein